jgi:cobalt/nickel transport system permease protein
MFDLFLDIFSCRDNACTRIDARVKLIIALAAIIFILLSSRMVLPLVFFVLCTGAMFGLGMPLRLVLARLAGPLGIVFVLVALMAFTQGSTVLHFVRFNGFGGFELLLREEGLLKGMLAGSRVLGAVSVVLLLGSITPAHKIFASLRWGRVPDGWVEIALLMYRYIFCLLEHTAEAVEAQKVRLGYVGARRSLSSVGTLAGIVVLRSLDQARQTHDAMMVRGYRGCLTFGPLPRLGRKDLASIFLTLFAIAITWAVLEWRVII